MFKFEIKYCTKKDSYLCKYSYIYIYIYIYTYIYINYLENE